MNIRYATYDDLDAVLEIFNSEIVNGVNAWHTEPIQGRDRTTWFEGYARPAYPLLVAETTDGAVIAWAGLSPWAKHGAYLRTAEVSVFVHKRARGEGVGRSLLSALIAEARDVSDHHVLIARIETSNAASRALHIHAGFEPVGIMREVGLKFGRYLDAEILQLIL